MEEEASCPTRNITSTATLSPYKTEKETVAHSYAKAKMKNKRSSRRSTTNSCVLSNAPSRNSPHFATSNPKKEWSFFGK